MRVLPSPHVGVSVETAELADGAVATAKLAAAAVTAAKLGYAADSTVIVQRGATLAASGVNLLAAYAAAAALTPGDSALAADNRATVLVPPGVYSLATRLVLLSFVDVIAMAAGDPEALVVTSVLATGTVYRAGNDGGIWDVHLADFTIENTGNSAGCHALLLYDDHAGETLPIYRNMRFRQPNAAADKSPVVSVSGKIGGKWYDCEADAYAWRSDADGEGLFGEWYRCKAGANSFYATGSSSQLDSVFEDVEAGADSFAAGVATIALEGTFRRVRCVGITQTIKVKDAAFRDSVFENVTASDTLFQLIGTNGASWYNCDLITKTGSGEISIGGTGPPEEIAVAHCRMNVALDALTNLIGTPYNVIDTDLVA